MTELTDAVASAARFSVGPWPAAKRRNDLHACAQALLDRGDEIVEVVMAETGLTQARLRGELDRTCLQLRQYGDHLATPWQRLSPAVAAGGADVITLAVPIGPVAVFAASNFPLAFGVSGTDTASALAAGCPVVVKAHPAQPRTGALLGEVLTNSLPEGAFHVVHGGAAVSIQLVGAAAIRAVGFTGSLAGGRALMDAAAARPEPIPVYAEMGSLNPVFVLPHAADDTRAAKWAETLAGAVTGSSGQLCTKPGLVVTDSPAFAAELAAKIAASTTHRMLTDAMADAHAAWLAQARKLGDVVAGEAAPQPFAVTVTTGDLSGDLLHEHFGPSTVIAVGDFTDVVPRLEGSLTATVIAADRDAPAAADLLPALASRAGRIIYNGVPTGVAVCDAMQHGGPWPATSAPWSTSVGAQAIERFRRPVAFQGVPAALLATHT